MDAPLIPRELASVGKLFKIFPRSEKRKCASKHLHPVEPILFPKFYNFFTLLLEANSYYPRGLIMRKENSHNIRNGLDRGVSVPGAFKLDHLHPVEPISFSKFYNFFTFILEANSYYPRGLIMRKGNSPNSRNGLDAGVSVLGAFNLDHLHPVEPISFSKFYNFPLSY